MLKPSCALADIEGPRPMPDAMLFFLIMMGSAIFVSAFVNMMSEPVFKCQQSTTTTAQAREFALSLCAAPSRAFSRRIQQLSGDSHFQKSIIDLSTYTPQKS